MTPVVLLFAVSLLQSCETQGTISVTPVFEQTGKDLLLHVKEPVVLKKGSDFKWKFNGSVNILKLDTHKESTIYDDYEERVEFSVQNYTLCLKNVQKADSGRYTAVLSAKVDKVVADYKVTVLDPVSPVNVSVKSISNSSDSCNFTVTCRTQDSHISSTFLCHNKTCSPEGGERSEVTPSSMNVYVKQGFIICNHSNPVSWKQDKLKNEHHCEQPSVSNGAVQIGIASGVAVFGTVLVIICSVFICRCYKKKSNGKTIYDVPQEVNPAQPLYEEPTDKTSPTSTYCLVEFHTRPMEPPRNTSQPETVYAQVNRAGKTNPRSPNNKHPELKNMDDNDAQD